MLSPILIDTAPHPWIPRSHLLTPLPFSLPQSLNPQENTGYLHYCSYWVLSVLYKDKGLSNSQLSGEYLTGEESLCSQSSLVFFHFVHFLLIRLSTSITTPPPSKCLFLAPTNAIFHFWIAFCWNAIELHGFMLRFIYDIHCFHQILEIRPVLQLFFFCHRNLG